MVNRKVRDFFFLLFGFAICVINMPSPTSAEEEIIRSSFMTINNEPLLHLEKTQEKSLEQSDPIGFELSENRFVFHPHLNNLSEFEAIVWTPTMPTNASGIIGTFHGEMASQYSCSETTNCRTGECFSENPITHDATLLMGLDNATLWIPQCPDTGVGGESALAISNLSDDGHLGIGFYTHSGDSFENSAPAFFQPWQTRPTSEGIEALYVNIPAHLNGQMKPFSGACSGADCGERIRLRIWGKQAVQQVETPAGTQAQQKLAFVLQNSADPTAEFIEYTPYTLCSGINCEANNQAHFSFDPNQGGTAYVGGRLMGGGQPTIMTVDSQSTIVWESYGPSSFSQPFGVEWFHYQVSWKNFKNTLRLFAIHAGYDGTNDAEVALLFGDGWDNRTNWELRQARFGQEIFNPDWATSTAYVGGFMSWYQLDAITIVPTSVEAQLLQAESSSLGQSAPVFILVFAILAAFTFKVSPLLATKAFLIEVQRFMLKN